MLTFVEITWVSFFYWIFVLKLYSVLCHQILVNLLTETGPFVYLTLGFFYWKNINKNVYRYCTILKCAFHLLLASVEITQVSFLLKLYVVLIISLLSCKLTYRQCVFEESSVEITQDFFLEKIEYIIIVVLVFILLIIRFGNN